MIVLGIETSCDDTAAAVIEDGRLRSSVVSSQDQVHGPFGGIVPELASRHHLENVLPVIHSALERAGVAIEDIGGVAVTRGPGLVGSLLVGLSTAQGIALARRIPLVGVNHLEGHLLAIFLVQAVEFPYLALLVSGGHTSLVLADAPGCYRVLGKTVDDAAGEAFDKAAKMLGLGFPGGREIDRLGSEGNPAAVRFPRPSVRGGRFDFSFSGLKTALRELLQGSTRHLPKRAQGAPATSRLAPGEEVSALASPLGELGEGIVLASLLPSRALPLAVVRDIAASFQEAVVDTLVDTTMAAAQELGMGRVVVSGGVSANSRLRAKMAAAGAERAIAVHVPPPRFCTDNAAMIAYAGARRLALGESDGLALNASASLAL